MVQVQVPHHTMCVSKYEYYFVTRKKQFPWPFPMAWRLHPRESRIRTRSERERWYTGMEVEMFLCHAVWDSGRL